MLELFISHSSADRSVAEALVELLEAALRLPPESIRCSSVDGYRLKAGASTNDQLRREVHEARAFIGLITPSSVESAYVLFELGARWGAGLHVIPLLACGADVTCLKGPLASLNALSCSSSSQLHQMVHDVAAVLQVSVGRPDTYSRHLERLRECSRIPSERLDRTLRPTVGSPIPQFADMRERKQFFARRITPLLCESCAIWSNDVEWDWPDDPNDDIVKLGGDIGGMDKQTREEIYSLAKELGLRVTLWST